MTDTVLFDERGRRVPKATYFPNSGSMCVGWLPPQSDAGTILGWSVYPTCEWRPTYYAARMAKGWRVFPLDYGVVEFITLNTAANWREPATPKHRRFPNIASVEVYLRTICAHG